MVQDQEGPGFDSIDPREQCISTAFTAFKTLKHYGNLNLKLDLVEN